MTKKALIVDDSRLACKVMAKMLDTLDFKCVEVYSAEEALVHLKFNIPDIIFLDHTMSGMDGLEVMKVIKANPQLSKIPVMMYTAKEGDYYVGQAIALGAVDVLPKGLDKNRLFNALKKVGLVSSTNASDPTSIKNSQVNADKLPLEELGDAALSVEKLRQENPSDKQLPKEPVDFQWLSFWKQRLEPYLEKQKNQQQKEFLYNTNEQTRKLIRDMHITLEQFEHALVLRMESHADFVSATEDVAKSSRRKWLASLAGLILISQMGIIWHLWETNEINQSLMLAQKQSIENHKQRDDLVEKTLLNLKDQFDNLTLASAISNNQNYHQSTLTPSNKPIADLHNEQGDLISSLVVFDSVEGSFLGISNTGYRFKVNIDGEVGDNLENRYYLTSDCSGDAFVLAEKGTIYKGLNKSLWYVDKIAEKTTIDILSTKTLENECIEISGEIMDLYPLQMNFTYETGLEENRNLKLTFLR